MHYICPIYQYRYYGARRKSTHTIIEVYRIDPQNVLEFKHSGISWLVSNYEYNQLVEDNKKNFDFIFIEKEFAENF